MCCRPSAGPARTCPPAAGARLEPRYGNDRPPGPGWVRLRRQARGHRPPWRAALDTGSTAGRRAAEQDGVREGLPYEVLGAHHPEEHATAGVAARFGRHAARGVALELGRRGPLHRPAGLLGARLPRVRRGARGGVVCGGGGVGRVAAQPVLEAVPVLGELVDEGLVVDRVVAEVLRGVQAEDLSDARMVGERRARLAAGGQPDSREHRHTGRGRALRVRGPGREVEDPAGSPAEPGTAPQSAAAMKAGGVPSPACGHGACAGSGGSPPGSPAAPHASSSGASHTEGLTSAARLLACPSCRQRCAVSSGARAGPAPSNCSPTRCTGPRTPERGEGARAARRPAVRLSSLLLPAALLGASGASRHLFR